MTLTWNKPLCTKRNGNITGYTYSFQKTGSSTYVVKDQITADEIITFTDLSASTEYTFSISANTRIGNGPVVTISTKTGTRN